MDLKATIRTIPDYPKPGIMFRDVTTLMRNAAALKQSVKQLAEPYRGASIAQVAGIEARGFILGAAVAVELGAGFVPLRKPGKLPYGTISEPYALEYGRDELHVHEDAVLASERILLVDDLIATGGTAEAALKLLRRAGGEVVSAAFLVDLPDLGGADKLRGAGIDVHVLLEFEGE